MAGLKPLTKLLLTVPLFAPRILARRERRISTSYCDTYLNRVRFCPFRGTITKTNFSQGPLR